MTLIMLVLGLLLTTAGLNLTFGLTGKKLAKTVVGFALLVAAYAVINFLAPQIINPVLDTIYKLVL